MAAAGDMTASRGLNLPSDWKRLEGDGFVVHADPLHESPLSFALSVAAGLDDRPRRLDARFLYDATGSELFDLITLQPEYYLTRAEDRLLAAGARAIRDHAGPSTLVELGSGVAAKTRRLLDAWCAAGPSTYVPVDVDLQGLRQACEALRRRYPSLQVAGLAARYERALAALQGAASPMTVAFLGSSLGNLGWHEYPQFCATIADTLAAGDHFLVGLDLVKEAAELEAAYNDAAGVTAAFTQNLFARMNRELRTDVSLDAIKHVAFYDSDHERIEIFAEARRELMIRIPELGREFRIAGGERILTEVSHKFRPDAAVATMERTGLRLVWADTGSGREAGSFGLFLFRRVSPSVRKRPPANRKGRAELDRLAATRARTLALVAPLSREDLRCQHSPLMSPIAWDLGHIAQFEAQWLLGERPETGADPGAPHGPAGLFDPLATPRARRSELPLPSVEAIFQGLVDVRRRVETRASAPANRPVEAQPAPPSREALPPRLEPSYAIDLVAEHEAQHQETILQAIALRTDLVYHPAFLLEAAPAPGGRPTEDSVLVPGGPFMMGAPGEPTPHGNGIHAGGFVYDNERPAHEVTLPDFRIDCVPVTNRQYLRFMDDGGYVRRELWSDAGWSWLQEASARAPAHWRSAPEGDRGPGWASEWQVVTFGRVRAPDPDCPVVHVSWYEADAYARWAGGRLPSEAEWEKAAAWDPGLGRARRFPWGDEPWELARANLDQRRLEPLPARAYAAGRSAYGCLQMLGDVWEWTASWFDGYPGFVSHPYREYSEIFFGDTYRVLRGGSFASRADVARCTFRNWDFPERRQIFAGFRCVRSV